jgi:SAM-dependent methyltransferase
MARRMDTVMVAPGLELRYGCERDALPDALRERFQPLAYDADAAQFVTDALAHPHGAWKTALYAGLRRVLSDYDAYGLLDMYAMHLVSTAQLQALLGTRGARGRALLDVGAGRGDITRRTVAWFEHVAATEASAVMRRRLRALGLEVLDHDLARAALPGSRRFDAILCLNVLDRCAYPRSLLQHLRAALATDGRLVLAVPLPLRPHVQQRGRTADPEEPLPAAEPTWEAGATRIAELLERAGFTVERLSRAPYVCRGDARARLHVLDDALFVCRAATSGEPQAQLSM